MKSQGTWILSVFAFALALSSAAPAATHWTRMPADDALRDHSWQAGHGWWTCVIDRPLYWYIGWARDRDLAAKAAVQACTEDGIVCTENEADCSLSED